MPSNTNVVTTLKKGMGYTWQENNISCFFCVCTNGQLYMVVHVSHT